MEANQKTPVFPFGIYRLEVATQQYDGGIKCKCNECKKELERIKPILEVSAQHTCVTFVCPNCGANNPLVYGPVQRVTWVPQSDPEHT